MSLSESMVPQYTSYLLVANCHCTFKHYFGGNTRFSDSHDWRAYVLYCIPYHVNNTHKTVRTPQHWDYIHEIGIASINISHTSIHQNPSILDPINYIHEYQSCGDSNATNSPFIKHWGGHNKNTPISRTTPNFVNLYLLWIIMKWMIGDPIEIFPIVFVFFFFSKIKRVGEITIK